MEEIMTLLELFKMAEGVPGHIWIWILIALLSIIQVAPVKLNPWDKIFAWLGNKLNGSLQKQVRELWINMHRQAILQFARECRGGQQHSVEEWSHVLNVADEYEMYCEKHEVMNGVVKQDTQYIRGLYQELSRDHKLG